jgi:hypothetical protein
MSLNLLVFSGVGRYKINERLSIEVLPMQCWDLRRDQTPVLIESSDGPETPTTDTSAT